MKNFKYMVYTIVLSVIVFSVNLGISNRVASEATHLLYLGSDVTNLGDYQTLIDNNIDLYVQNGNMILSDELNTSFISSSPNYFFVDKTYSTNDLNSGDISIKFSGSEINREIIEDYLGVNIVLYPISMHKETSSLVLIGTCLVLLIILFCLVITNLLYHQQNILIQILQGYRKRKIIFNVAALFNFKNYAWMSIIAFVITIFITRPLNNLSFVVFFISMGSIVCFELLIYLVVDIAYEIIIKVSSSTFVNKSLRFTGVKLLLNISLTIVSALLVMSILTATSLYNDYKMAKEYEVDYLNQFADLYYADYTSMAVSDSFDFKVDDTSSKVFTYEISERVLLTDQYYISNFSKYKDLGEFSLIVLNDQTCDDVEAKELIEWYQLSNCTESNSRDQLYDYIVNFGEVTEFTGGFINAISKEEAIQILEEIDSNYRYFYVFDKYENVSAARIEKMESEMKTIFTIEIAMSLLFIVIVAMYVYICIEINQLQYSFDILRGKSLFKRYKKLIYNVIINYAITISVVSLIYKMPILLLLVWFIQIFVTVIFITLFDLILIKRNLVQRINYD